MIELRDIQENDVKMLFEWRNTPFIIKLGTLQKEVSWDEHKSWFVSSLNNKNRKIFIVELERTPIGQVRFDKSGIGTCTISVYLLEQYTGKGLGVESIKKGCSSIFEKWEDVTEIIAIVRIENENSQKSFIKAGFKEKKENQGNEHKVYILQRNNDQIIDTNFNISYYTDRLNNFGLDYKSLNWGSQNSQFLRFKILCEIANLNNDSILDVGCGLSDLYNYLKESKIDVNYSGIDITPKMIEQSKNRFPNLNYYTGDILEMININNYDYIFSSGLFTYMKNAGLPFVKAMLKRFYEICNKGVAVNFLSSFNEEVDSQEFVINPSYLLEYCSNLTPFVTLRHDYLKHDFTIYMYKNQQK